MPDGEFSMFESGAMIEYVLERHGDGRLRPAPGTRKNLLDLQWSWFAEATLARPLGSSRIMRSRAGVRRPSPEQFEAVVVRRQTCCLRKRG